MIALLLNACGLEPRYALPPPERSDGAFRWVDAAASPPAGYLPVTVDAPGSGREVAVCRGFIADTLAPEDGYYTGELAPEGDGTYDVCLVAHRGGLLRFSRRDNAYQQLWARAGATYRWVALADIAERPLALSALWQNNRVPSDYVIREGSGEEIALWMPCARQDAQGWHVGKLNLREREPIPCYIQLAGREVAIYDGIVVLYAPAR